jgi:hypothetical protein
VKAGPRAAIENRPAERGADTIAEPWTHGEARAPLPRFALVFGVFESFTADARSALSAKRTSGGSLREPGGSLSSYRALSATTTKL